LEKKSPAIGETLVGGRLRKGGRDGRHMSLKKKHGQAAGAARSGEKEEPRSFQEGEKKVEKTGLRGRRNQDIGRNETMNLFRVFKRNRSHKCNQGNLFVGEEDAVIRENKPEETNCWPKTELGQTNAPYLRNYSNAQPSSECTRWE